VRLQIDFNLDEAYTVADLDGDIATEVARSVQGLREILRLMGAPREMTEDIITRIHQERIIQVVY
jgi:hypothetical protein